MDDFVVASDNENESEKSEHESMDSEEADQSEEPSKLSLTNAFEKKVRPYIDLVDELRRHGLEQDINLPSVVVIGDQSSGKSSILEAISGIQLPRGSGIVTRCPLEMQLKKVHDRNAKWVARMRYRPESGNEKSNVINEPADMETAIRRAQNEIAGHNKGISASLITLKVESPDCPDLTLIDLPGIARTAVEDQPPDICKQIKSLLTDHIEKEHTIMLCVLPANVDIAVNEALTMAREVDPEGIRTLGVITKPDLVDSGAELDVLAILQNEKVYLKKGYSIVRCRGQQEILDKIGLEEALREEERFFKAHRIFKKADPPLRGTKNLALKLTDNLVQHIEKTLPKLREEVRVQLEETRRRLNNLADGPPNEEAEKRLYLMRLIDAFLRKMNEVVRNGTKIPTRLFNKSISGPTKLVNSAYKWRRLFEELKKKIDGITANSFQHGELSIPSIESKMEFYRGRELPRFINFELFESLVQEHISNYEEPIFSCLNVISRDLVVIMEYVSDETLRHVPLVKGHVRGVCEDVREDCKKDCSHQLSLEMRKENLVYTQDPTYVEELDKLEKEEEERQQRKQSGRKKSSMSFRVTRDADDDDDENKHNAMVMQQLLVVYLEVANRRILDSVPMLVRTLQHHEFIDRLTLKLQQTASGDKVDELVQEDSKLSLERTQLQNKCKRLSHAMTMLNYI